ncbi:hypothetical protein A9996_19305 [Gelidibacter algens]|uniref:hypothetical protein n=1 Tax=Gelidibacter algens TaxID=49280 RepID=UPI000804AFA3|nr:hypothetical protein [Gelidibacter algens]OBX17544.1 hypothetical protein A9996_19305 [Gelidibacter algens]
MNIFKKINNVKSFLIDSKHIYFVNIIDKSLFKIDFALNQIDSFKEFNSYEIVDYYDFIINYSLLFVNKEKFQKNIEILNNFNLTLVNTINEQEILVKKIDDEAKKVTLLKN